MTRAESPPVRWWAERQLWLVLALLAVGVLPRLGAIPFRGEEHRRAQVTEEMARAGDWVVPRDQGEVFRSRPPMQQWVIAGTEWAFGSRERWVIRLPSAVAVMLMATLLYGYARQFVGRTGAVVAALAYATGGEVLEQAQHAETESLFVFFLGGSLLLWHWGYTRNWPAGLTWGIAYLFAAAAGLCKGGLQPPVYLVGAAGLYLFWRRDLRFAFSAGHLLGLAVGLAAVAAWAVPCSERVGWEATRAVWMSDTSGRMVDWQPGPFLAHFALFPLQLLPCLLPWGLLIPAAFFPAVRRAVSGCDAVAFCLFALAVAVPSCWIPPEGRPRYLVPVYPCFAVLVGVLADRAATAAAARRAWRWYLTAVAMALAVVAAVAAVGVWLFPGTKFELLALPAGRAVAYATVLLGLAAVVFRSRGVCSPRAAFAVAAGAVVVMTGIVTDSRSVRTNDIAAVVSGVRDRIPADVPVVAVGEVHAAVRYYLGEVVPRVPEVPPGAYFCTRVLKGEPPDLPFAWEEVAVVSVDRFRSAEPAEAVLVGRRVR